jgi:hypothetical protein
MESIILSPSRQPYVSWALFPDIFNIILPSIPGFPRSFLPSSFEVSIFFYEFLVDCVVHPKLRNIYEILYSYLINVMDKTRHVMLQYFHSCSEMSIIFFFLDGWGTRNDFWYRITWKYGMFNTKDCHLASKAIDYTENWIPKKRVSHCNWCGKWLVNCKL